MKCNDKLDCEYCNVYVDKNISRGNLRRFVLIIKEINAKLYLPTYVSTYILLLLINLF